MDDAVGGAMKSAKGLAGGLLGSADSGLQDDVLDATDVDLQDAALGAAETGAANSDAANSGAAEDLATDPKETLLQDSKEKLSGLLNR